MKNILFVLFIFSGTIWAQEKNEEIKFHCQQNKPRLPMVIIDGYIQKEGKGLKELDPQDIESIKILKDSAFSLIYGDTRYGVIIITTRNAKIQYEATVLDAGFDTFVATQPSKKFFSESSLRAKNILMVNEWNMRYANPTRYDANIYEVNIDYNPNISYGIDVEYTLYMFFRFMEKENKMALI